MADGRREKVPCPRTRVTAREVWGCIPAVTVVQLCGVGKSPQLSETQAPPLSDRTIRPGSAVVIKAKDIEFNRYWSLRAEHWARSETGRVSYLQERETGA